MSPCSPNDSGRLSISRDWTDHGTACLTALTASELLVGVQRAQTDVRRNRRNAFVENLLAAIPVLPFDLKCARVHAQLVASLPRNGTVGAHDALIGATALRHGRSVLTGNGRDLRKLAGVAVVDDIPPAGAVDITSAPAGEPSAAPQAVLGAPLQEVTRILARFSKWVGWDHRHELANTDRPGVSI